MAGERPPDGGDVSTFQALKHFVPSTTPITTPAKWALFKQWCQENRGCVGSADALSMLIGPSDMLDVIAEVERLQARLDRYEQAIYEHRNNVMSLGMHKDERTGELVHGGEYDRRLWSELPEDAGSGGMW